jgi:sulfate permease, SulP family
MRLDLQESLPHTPRRAQLRDAGRRTIASGMLILSLIRFSSQYRYSIGANKNKRGALASVVEPFHALEQAFSPYVADCTILQQLAPYFERVAVPAGHVLWKQGDPADGLYVIEAGVLRATYCFASHTPAIEESMVPGTLAGELSGLAGLPRNATVIVEQAAVLWYLDGEALGRLQAEHPELARTFTALVLKGACCHIFVDERKMLIVITCDWCG